MNMIKTSDSCKNRFQSFYKLPVISDSYNLKHLSLQEKSKKKQLIFTELSYIG